MKHRTNLGALCLVLAMSMSVAVAAPPAKPQLGMNLTGPADWNTELPFVDVFRMARPWVSQRQGASWGKGPPLALDEYGWVTRLESNCWAETPLCTIEGGHYPSGEYTVLYDGEGKLDFWGAARIVTNQPGRLVIQVDSAKGGFFLKLVETNPQNHVRNIRVIMPGFAETYRTNPWHTAFLKRWQGLACFRFMDWMETNGSKICHWSERPKLDDATFSARGIALELMIDLCNRQNADAWFCMPHLADDEYVRNFARLVKEKLNPKLKVYIEYSNEVWNGIFPQHRYAEEKARELGLGPRDRPWEGAGMFYAQRSQEILRIWEDVFGGRDRLVRVIAWQAASGPYWTDGIVLSHRETFKQTDALAIAPYVTMCIGPNSKPDSATVAGWTVAQVLEYAETHALPESIGWIKTQKQIADKYGLKLIAYEGGQHLVGVGGGENNEAMTRLFHTANAHPRMGQIYQKYLDAWASEGGDLFSNFSSVGRWSKWGSWGLLQFSDDDPTRSPKFTATMRWAKQHGQPVAWEEK